MLYFVHAEHSTDGNTRVKERYYKLKDKKDPAGWEKLEESQYLWTAMLISKDEEFVAELVKQKVDFVELIRTSASPMTFLY